MDRYGPGNTSNITLTAKSPVNPLDGILDRCEVNSDQLLMALSNIKSILIGADPLTGVPSERRPGVVAVSERVSENLCNAICHANDILAILSSNVKCVESAK